ncbi:hypothetical protein EVAR_99448_1 [Eumeta japonica]|uniref:Uncharacterized protein n=1 Tax=Eumeta variegata TaxID=151549 RepID=A0A4C2A4S0_EUMVA|nr:hypothetical protein EVAR_99448_1 [Eumeta japonica]
MCTFHQVMSLLLRLSGEYWAQWACPAESSPPRPERDLKPRGFFFSPADTGESWVQQTKHESTVNAMEMRSLYSMCGVSKNRCRNSNVREQYGLKEDIVTRVERDMFVVWPSGKDE